MQPHVVGVYFSFCAMRYWAFISYGHGDERWAQWLHKAIEGYRVPGRLVGRSTHTGIIPRRLFPVFRDRDELPSSHDLGASIVESLKQSRFLIVICSPKAAASRWVNEEVKTFKSLGREDRILCVVVEGEPNASDRPDSPHLECFPPAVRYRVSSDGVLGQERSEPLAADARAGRDGRSDVKLKVLSGLLGVGFDELKLREKERERAGQRVSLLFAFFVGALLLLPNGPIPPLRFFVFDTYQVLKPRMPQSAPVTVVAIDQKSLAMIGQWPWPRTSLARIVTKIADAKPAAIGFDLLFPEADELSPERMLARAGIEDTALAKALAGRPSNDAVFASALTSANAVLAVAGVNEHPAVPVRAPPFTVLDALGTDAAATRQSLYVPRYAGVLTSIEVLDRAAFGRGLISVDPEGGVIRRMPLVASVDGVLVPALAIEMLRRALGAPSVTLQVSGSSVQGISTGDFTVPTEADGAVRIYYSRRMPGRFVSAIDVLEGRHDLRRFENKLVLIGVTGLGLLEYQSTPVGRMPGSEIHAQLLENFYDDSLLRRPEWAKYVELSVFCLFGLLFILGVPRWSATWSIFALLACCAMVAMAGMTAFSWGRLLFDPVQVIGGLVAVFGAIMSYGFFAHSARLPDARAVDGG